MRLSTYTVFKDEHSKCPMCDEYLTLLSPRNATQKKPWFYICWLCKNVTQVGVGPVREEA